MSYTESELAGLTPDEQDALLAETEEQDTVDEAVVDKDAPIEVAPEEDAAEEVVAAEDEPVAKADFQVELKSSAPEGIGEMLADIDAKSKALFEQLESGDVGFQEFFIQKEVLDSEKMQLKLAEAQSTWVTAQNADANAQRWKWEQERFFAQKSTEMYNDPMVFAALDACVKKLAVDPANSGKAAGWFLEESDRQVRKLFNLGVAPVSSTPPAALPKAQPTIRTIGGLPAAAQAPVGDDVMSKIGSLEGEDLERYMAKMSPADVDKLMRSA